MHITHFLFLGVSSTWRENISCPFTLIPIPALFQPETRNLKPETYFSTACTAAVNGKIIKNK